MAVTVTVTVNVTVNVNVNVTVNVTVTVKVTVTVNVTVTVTVTATATVTVTVTVNRLGALGPGCASCGLLYGYYEARRVEGWKACYFVKADCIAFEAGLCWMCH